MSALRLSSQQSIQGERSGRRCLLFPTSWLFSLQAWPPSCYISINTTTHTRLCGDLKHMHKPKYLNLYAGHWCLHLFPPPQNAVFCLSGSVFTYLFISISDKQLFPKRRYFCKKKQKTAPDCSVHFSVSLVLWPECSLKSSFYSIRT